MSTLSNLKNSMTHADLTKSSEAGSDASASTGSSPLKTALSAARNRANLEETLKAKDNAELAEEQVMRLFEQELVQEADQMTETEATSSESKKSTIVEKNNSARVLELHRKQASCSQMQTKIRENATIVSALVTQAEDVTNYLTKIEVELAQLENIEEKATALAEANAELKRRYDEDKLDLQEKIQQIAVLETQKNAHRDTIDKAKAEIARLNEQKNTQQSEINSSKALAAKMESDLQSVFEKLEAQQREHKDRLAEQNDRIEKLTAVAETSRQKDKDLARVESDFEELRKTHQAQAIEMADIRSKLASQTAQSLEQKSELDEARFEASSARGELEKTVRLKDARIAELESKLEMNQHRALHGEDEVFRLPPLKGDRTEEAKVTKAAKSNKPAAERHDQTLN